MGHRAKQLGTVLDVERKLAWLSLGRKADRGGVVSDLNTIEGTGFYTGYNNPKGAPVDQSGAHWHIIHMQYNSSWKAQIAISLGGGDMYRRTMFEGAWKPWIRV